MGEYNGTLIEKLTDGHYLLIRGTEKTAVDTFIDLCKALAILYGEELPI